MKIYTIYTDEIECLKDIFVKSMKDDWETVFLYWDTIDEKEGDFGTPGFITHMRQRVETVRTIIKKNWGDIIIWSDIDIQFFRKCSKLIEKAMVGKDIVFQSESWPKKEVNGGFIVIRCNEKSLLLYETVLKTDFEKLPYFEQTAMNEILTENKIGIRWGILPRPFWAMSCHYDPPVDIALHHANCTFPRIVKGKTIGSLEQKLSQFKRVRRYVFLLKLWTKYKRVFPWWANKFQPLLKKYVRY
jgi:hypothetical protein